MFCFFPGYLGWVCVLQGGQKGGGRRSRDAHCPDMESIFSYRCKDRRETQFFAPYLVKSRIPTFSALRKTVVIRESKPPSPPQPQRRVFHKNLQLPMKFPCNLSQHSVGIIEKPTTCTNGCMYWRDSLAGAIFLMECRLWSSCFRRVARPCSLDCSP